MKTNKMNNLLNAIARVGVLFGSALCSNATLHAQYTTVSAANPSRIIVSDATGWAATFTQGARTVAVRGADRNYTEPSLTTTTFTSRVRVRTLQTPFDGVFNVQMENWLTGALTDTSADAIEKAMQYIQGAPAMTDASGIQFAGDADYGPLDPAWPTQDNEHRLENSDWNDYLGVSADYGYTVRAARPERLRSMDCSGFIRMVWGIRSGFSLTYDVPNGTAIPRRSYQILDSAPGVVIVANAGTQVTDMSKLQEGDIVFFDADTNDGAQIDHVGMYIGKDAKGDYRFISSRKTVNGPTFATDVNLGGKSILNGASNWYWPARFRAVRRF